MNELKDCTLLVPTYNSRYGYLKRLLEYYNDSGVKLLIVDSSKKKLPFVKDYKNVKYLYVKNMPYLNKISKALNSVKTKYVALCGDDDFTVPSGLYVAAKFLNKHKDYSAAQGITIIYSTEKDVLKFYQTPHNLISMSQSKILARINNLPSYEIMYSLHRTKNLQETFNFSKKLKFDNTMEYALLIKSLIDGKHKVLPVVFSVRDNTIAAKQHRTKDIAYIKKNAKSDYDALLKFLSKKLVAKIDISDSQAKKLFDEAITRHVLGANSSNIIFRKIRNSIMFGTLNTINVFSENVALFVKKKYVYRALKEYELKKIVKKNNIKNILEIDKIAMYIKNYKVE